MVPPPRTFLGRQDRSAGTGINLHVFVFVCMALREGIPAWISSFSAGFPGGYCTDGPGKIMEVEEVLSVLPTLLAWAEGANQRIKDARMTVVWSQPQGRSKPALRIAEKVLGNTWGGLGDAGPS